MTHGFPGFNGSPAPAARCSALILIMASVGWAGACPKVYSEYMKLAQLPSTGGIRNVQLDGSCTGDSHAPVHLHTRSPRRPPPRALPPPPPPRATEDGSRLAQQPGAHPRGHRPPSRRVAP